MKLPLNLPPQKRPRNLEELFAADAAEDGLHLLADVAVNPLKHIKNPQVAESAQQVLDFVGRYQHLPEDQAAYKDFADKEAAAAWYGLQQHYPQVAQDIRTQVQAQLTSHKLEATTTSTTTNMPSSKAAALTAVRGSLESGGSANTQASDHLTATTSSPQTDSRKKQTPKTESALTPASEPHATEDKPTAATATITDTSQVVTASVTAPASASPPAASLPKVYQSIDEVLAEGDALGLFADIDAALQIQPQTQFTLQPESATAFKPRHRAVDAAVSGICPDYDTYEPLMKRCVELLRSKDLATSPVTEYKYKKLKPGQFYLLHGLIALIARSDIGSDRIRNEHNKPSYRVKVVYNNSTQYSPWNYSFLEALINDKEGASLHGTTSTGKCFLQECEQTLSAAQAQEELQRQEQEAIAKGQATGYVYILQSLSKHQTLTQFQQHSELIKVGFCTTTVEERIKNAEHSSTYLYAPVRVVRTYRCTNIDPQKLEHLVQALLHEHRLYVTLMDKVTGKQCKPEEWFTVSPKTACEIVDHILDGTIMQYRVDSVQGKLVKIGS